MINRLMARVYLYLLIFFLESGVPGFKFIYLSVILVVKWFLEIDFVYSVLKFFCLSNPNLPVCQAL